MTSDYRSPCHMIWDLAGNPPPTAPAKGEGLCALCGDHGPLHLEIGSNFTDYRKLATITGTRLCRPCSWTIGGRPPNSLRMWSVVARVDQPAPASQPRAYVTGTHLHLTNRKDMRWVAATLAAPPADGSPWLVAVAETGQKHTAPFTAVNHGTLRWTVHLDGADITSSPAEWRRVLSHTVVLRAAGFTAAAVESGQPPIAALTSDRLPVWQTHAPHLAAYLGTPLLHLTNLMITKETMGEFTSTYQPQ